MSFDLHPLPLSDSVDLESRAILRQLARSHRHLAELKGAAATIPNEAILIDTLALQEARDSSAIENIITTQDDLFQADALAGSFANAATKEVITTLPLSKSDLTASASKGLFVLRTF